MNFMPKAPLFRDPIYDGAADPTIIWNREEKQWWIFYTARRASVSGSGFTWIHGSDIGIASSADGCHWLYRGTAQGLVFEMGHNTFWAPEIIYENGIYHMYCSYVRGIPEDWNCERDIIHYTSENLWEWSFQSILSLSSDRVIDACVFETGRGLWKMWYKDEKHESHTWAAQSHDLYHWEVIGPEITDCAHEGPNVFSFKGINWMIMDFWKGLGVYSSTDFSRWNRKADILDQAGIREDDTDIGHHADVLVCEDRAFIFYFVHPRLTDEELLYPEPLKKYLRQRSSLQVAELYIDGENLYCNREPDFIDLSCIESL